MFYICIQIPNQTVKILKVCNLFWCLQKSACLFRVLSHPKLENFCKKGLWRKNECAPLLQFREIYEWTKLKGVRVCTQREFGRRDLRSAVWVIIQSSHSHISHFESHRLWERPNSSYTQVAHVQAPKCTESQNNTHTDLSTRCLFLLWGNVIPR